MQATYLTQLILIKFISRCYLTRCINYEQLYTTYNIPNLIKKFLSETFINWSMKASELLLWFYSPLLGLGCFFSFLILYTVGRTPLTGYQPVARPLPTQRTTQTQNKRTQTSMPRVEFEPTIPAFEQAKTVHTLGRAATVIGQWDIK
jgi:hypothetical protein